MKKTYISPEFKVTKFEFESTLASAIVDSINTTWPSEEPVGTQSSTGPVIVDPFFGEDPGNQY